MAAWYIFNSLGFYPVTPGTGEYVIGMPLLDKATIALSNGKTLTIETSPNQQQHQFIHEVKRKNLPHTDLFFTHEDLLEGGTISYRLGIVPNAAYHHESALPYSLSEEID